jgi:uncharacterized membrane protein
MIRFFEPAQEEAIIQAIRQAEKNTSGEIRVHLHESTDRGLMKDAREAFKKMGMHRTKARNGVLIFIIPSERQFAIIGDRGIDQVVPEGFWDEIKDQMQACFREGDFVKGVCLGIEATGKQLMQYFPYQSDDENELPDEISYGGQK